MESNFTIQSEKGNMTQVSFLKKNGGVIREIWTDIFKQNPELSNYQINDLKYDAKIKTLKGIIATNSKKRSVFYQDKNISGIKDLKNDINLDLLALFAFEKLQQYTLPTPFRFKSTSITTFQIETTQEWNGSKITIIFDKTNPSDENRRLSKIFHDSILEVRLIVNELAKEIFKDKSGTLAESSFPDSIKIPKIEDSIKFKDLSEDLLILDFPNKKPITQRTLLFVDKQGKEYFLRWPYYENCIDLKNEMEILTGLKIQVAKVDNTDYPLRITCEPKEQVGALFEFLISRASQTDWKDEINIEKCTWVEGYGWKGKKLLIQKDSTLLISNIRFLEEIILPTPQIKDESDIIEIKLNPPHPYLSNEAFDKDLTLALKNKEWYTENITLFRALGLLCRYYRIGFSGISLEPLVAALSPDGFSFDIPKKVINAYVLESMIRNILRDHPIHKDNLPKRLFSEDPLFNNLKFWEDFDKVTNDDVAVVKTALLQFNGWDKEGVTHQDIGISVATPEWEYNVTIDKTSEDKKKDKYWHFDVASYELKPGKCEVQHVGWL